MPPAFCQALPRALLCRRGQVAVQSVKAMPDNQALLAEEKHVRGLGGVNEGPVACCPVSFLLSGSTDMGRVGHTA